MSTPMKFLAAIATLVALLAAIILLLPQLIPAATYKGQIEAAASRSLGRDVTVGDDLSFKIFPQTAFRVSDFTIANPDGFEGAPFVTVDSANIGVSIWPLLTNRSIEIDRFVLSRPVLNLVRQADGTTNWALGDSSADTSAPDDTSAQDDAPGQAQPASDLPVRNLKLGDVRLVDGQARYSDEATGQNFEAQSINVRTRLDSIAEPLELNGDLVFQGAPTRINLILTSVEKLLDGDAADLKFELALDKASASADMAVKAGPAPLSYEGRVTFNAPDLPALAQLLGVSLADAPGYDRFSIKANMRGDDKNITLGDSEIVFDEIKATGDLALALSGPRPKATGKLDADILDLRPYMPEAAESDAGFPEWSEDRLDFSSLRNLDADLDINAQEVLVNNLTIGASTLKVDIDNGRMTAEIPQMSLYRGGGSGRLVVNARGATPSFSGIFDLTSINAEPFGIDFLNTDKLLGLGAARFEFTASGATQKAIMNSIDGKGGFDLNDGAVKGLNLVKLAQTAGNLTQGGVPNPAALSALITDVQKPAEETEFTRFLSQFSIEDGLITAPTINLDGPFLTMAGTGTINLPAQTIDLRLVPRATTSATGESAARAIAIPVRIGGTFNAPKVTIDAESLVRGRAETIGRDLIGRALGNASGNSGDGAPAADANADVETKVKDLATGALGRLFGEPKKAPAETSPEETSPEQEPKPTEPPSDNPDGE